MSTLICLPPTKIFMVMFFTFTLSNSSRNLSQPRENSWTTQLSILIGYYICESIKTHLHWLSHCEWTAHKPLTHHSDMVSASAEGIQRAAKETVRDLMWDQFFMEVLRDFPMQRSLNLSRMSGSLMYNLNSGNVIVETSVNFQVLTRLANSIFVARVLQISWWCFLLPLSFFRSRIWQERCYRLFRTPLTFWISACMKFERYSRPTKYVRQM